MSATYRIPILAPRLVRDGTIQADTRTLNGPGGAASILRSFVPDDGREHFGIVLLNVRNRIIGVVEVSVGCLTSSLVHPRDLYRPAIAGGAAAVILYHNHPSGDVEPSAEDLSITRRLSAAGTLLGIEVVDHIILGDGTDHYVSLHERGIL